jgi:hypothetical protein
MLYLSLALIFLGIIIFLYSIMLDAKRRRDKAHVSTDPGRVVAPADKAPVSGGIPESRGPSAASGAGNRGKRVPKSAPAQVKGPSREEKQSAGGVATSRLEEKAVLFEDKSEVIDYSNDSGSIDPSLEKYKHIKRIGSGTISVEPGGLTFYMGKKIYRYDYHRIRDIKAGKSHLAVFLMGSGSVKLFII